MGFGCSYSLVEVDCIDFVKTPLKKKIFRGILGCCLSILIRFCFELLN